LFKEVAGFEWFRGKTYNKALIDPARSGAIEIIELLPKLGAFKNDSLKPLACI
jgi:23S rRNA (uracil1939-C5)-methyltransferase